MIFKALLVFCLVSAVVCEDPDSLGEIGSTETTISTKATEPTYTPCVTREGANGECVPYYRCQYQEPGDLLDIHMSIEETCESYLDICCAPEDQIDPFAEETKASK